MVVIIDDRADVWEWSPNLVKVIPCKFDFSSSISPDKAKYTHITDEFFVGIGDINSAFLPKLEPLTPVLTPPQSATPVPGSSPAPSDSSTPPLSQSLSQGDIDTDMTTPPDSPTGLAGVASGGDLLEDEVEDETVSALRKNEILHRNHEALDAQVEERPLAKMQEALQEAESTSAPAVADTNGSEESSGSGETATNPIPVNGEPSAEPTTPSSEEPTPSVPGGAKKEKVVRKALLKNDDYELNRVQAVRLTLFPRTSTRRLDRSSGALLITSPPSLSFFVYSF